MKSLMTFVGILTFNSLTATVAADFSCPVAKNLQIDFNPALIADLAINKNSVI